MQRFDRTATVRITVVGRMIFAWTKNRQGSAVALPVSPAAPPGDHVNSVIIPVLSLSQHPWIKRDPNTLRPVTKGIGVPPFGAPHEPTGKRRLKCLVRYSDLTA